MSRRTQLALGNSGVTFETMVNTIAANKATLQIRLPDPLTGLNNQEEKDFY